MDKGKLRRMMKRGKYEVLRVKWTEEEEEEKFRLLPAPPSSEAPPHPPLTGGGGRLRRFAMGLIGMIRTVAASIAGRPDVIPVDIIGPANNQADATKDDDDNDFNEAKCVVGAGRTYCRNCPPVPPRTCASNLKKNTKTSWCFAPVATQRVSLTLKSLILSPLLLGCGHSFSMLSFLLRCFHFSYYVVALSPMLLLLLQYCCSSFNIAAPSSMLPLHLDVASPPSILTLQRVSRDENGDL